MTRKDYERFAAMLAGELAIARALSHPAERTAATVQVTDMIRRTADIFAQDSNGRFGQFDRKRFYQACGLY